MTFRPTRLRRGEWLMGAAGLALIIVLFALPWYGLKGVFGPTADTLGVPVNSSGWQSLAVVRILILLAGAGGIVAWWLQATRAAPALPACAVVLDALLSLIVFVALIDRVLIDRPGNHAFIGAKPGAYVGLALGAALLGGAYLSLRDDGIAPQDAPASIETLRLAPRSRPGGA